MYSTYTRDADVGTDKTERKINQSYSSINIILAKVVIRPVWANSKSRSVKFPSIIHAASHQVQALSMVDTPWVALEFSGR